MKAQRGLLALASVALLAGCTHTMGYVEHIDLDKTPPAVLDGFHHSFPGLPLLHTDRVTYMDKTEKYELKFRDANNDYHRRMFSADGKLLDSTQGVALPAGATMVT